MIRTSYPNRNRIILISQLRRTKPQIRRDIQIKMPGPMQSTQPWGYMCARNVTGPRNGPHMPMLLDDLRHLIRARDFSAALVQYSESEIVRAGAEIDCELPR